MDVYYLLETVLPTLDILLHDFPAVIEIEQYLSMDDWRMCIVKSLVVPILQLSLYCTSYPLVKNIIIQINLQPIKNIKLETLTIYMVQSSSSFSVLSVRKQADAVGFFVHAPR